MNRGRTRRTLPDLTNAKVEFVECRKRSEMKWVATLYINGWPHDIGFWAKDELDVMKQVFAMQRGEQPDNAFDRSQ